MAARMSSSLHYFFYFGVKFVINTAGADTDCDLPLPAGLFHLMLSLESLYT